MKFEIFPDRQAAVSDQASVVSRFFDCSSLNKKYHGPVNIVALKKICLFVDFMKIATIL